MSFGQKQQAVKQLNAMCEKLTILNQDYLVLGLPFTRRSAAVRKGKLFLEAFSKISGDVSEALAATTRMVGPGDKDLTNPQCGYSTAQAFARWLNRLVFALADAVAKMQNNEFDGIRENISNIGNGSKFIEVLGGSQFLRLYWKVMEQVRHELEVTRTIMINVSECS